MENNIKLGILALLLVSFFGICFATDIPSLPPNGVYNFNEYFYFNPAMPDNLNSASFYYIPKAIFSDLNLGPETAIAGSTSKMYTARVVFRDGLEGWEYLTKYNLSGDIYYFRQGGFAPKIKYKLTAGDKALLPFFSLSRLGAATGSSHPLLTIKYSSDSEFDFVLNSEKTSYVKTTDDKQELKFNSPNSTVTFKNADNTPKAIFTFDLNIDGSILCKSIDVRNSTASTTPIAPTLLDSIVILLKKINAKVIGASIAAANQKAPSQVSTNKLIIKKLDGAIAVPAGGVSTTNAGGASIEKVPSNTTLISNTTGNFLGTTNTNGLYSGSIFCLYYFPSSLETYEFVAQNGSKISMEKTWENAYYYFKDSSDLSCVSGGGKDAGKESICMILTSNSIWDSDSKVSIRCGSAGNPTQVLTSNGSTLYASNPEMFNGGVDRIELNTKTSMCYPSVKNCLLGFVIEADDDGFNEFAIYELKKN